MADAHLSYRERFESFNRKLLITSDTLTEVLFSGARVGGKKVDIRK